jgi:serine/threonine-protein kinase
VPGSTPDDEFIGQVIGGKYQIRGVLGRGGMGTVFEAVHIGIGRQSAIKVLHSSQLRKKDAVRRFHQEAKAAARIGHPNICEVYDLGTLEDGRPYLVMEKLVGETLADAIARDGGLPFADVVDILRQVLSGLYAAHENGIIHRDIKPENVFLSKRVGCPPVAKLLDFGVSKMMSHHPQSKEDGDLEMTRTGVVLGTPYYLAPEQARGDRNLDARVDLYACGVMLYEALTGRRPFVAANYNALLVQILTGAPRPIRELRTDIPEDLELIVAKAMSREKHQRYHTAIDFQSDLPQYDARPPPSRVPPPRASSRPPPPEGVFPLQRRAPQADAIPLAPRAPSIAMSPPPRGGPDEHQLRATRAGAPPQGATSKDRGTAGAGGTTGGREALLNALPIASPFLPPPAGGPPPSTRPGPLGGPPPPSTRAGAATPLQASLSSSEEIDALIAVETPSAVPQARPASARSKGAGGFEDQATEIQVAPLPFLDDVSTAQMRAEEAAHAREHARKAAHPPAPSAARRQTLVTRRSGEFNDESKTDVMTADLRSKMRELRQGTPPAGPAPDTHSTSARSRKR